MNQVASDVHYRPTESDLESAVDASIDVTNDTPADGFTSPKITAATRLFNTFELVEQLLLELRLEEILLVSSTTTYIRQVVESSKPIFKRFYNRVNGFERRTELIHHETRYVSWRSVRTWDAESSFGFWTYIDTARGYTLVDVFLYRKGDSEAIACLNRGKFGRNGWLRLADGVDVGITFKQIDRSEWQIRINGFEADRTFLGELKGVRRPNTDMIDYL